MNGVGLVCWEVTLQCVGHGMLEVGKVGKGFEVGKVGKGWVGTWLGTPM